jgi:magnesium-dependent phosphatase 1
MSLPRLVAFDLDGTVWSPDMYQLWGGGAPFAVKSSTELTDCANQRVRLLGSFGAILDELCSSAAWSGATTAWVSCTDEPAWADECLRKFRTPSGSTLKELVSTEVIYKANKQTHFRELHESTGIPFCEMIFFDNERGNINSVAKLGVCSVYCPDGMTDEIWRRGLAQYAEQQSDEVKDFDSRIR